MIQTLNLPDGLTVRVLRQAPAGRQLQAGDLVGVYYAGTLTNGTPFDANYNFDGNKPLRNLFAFTLGQNRVIQGWERGLLNRHIGEVVELTIPAPLAYGSSGQGSIPPNATLVFRVILAGMIPADQLSLPRDQQKSVFFDLEALGLSGSTLGFGSSLPNDLPLLVGTELDDTIIGRSSSELTAGQNGRELIIGLQGNDRLAGGADRDLLVGGAGRDTFLYQAVSDSAAGAATRDQISDFRGNLGDRIDLRGVDANSKRSGDQAFRYLVAKPFSGQAGDLRYSAGVLMGDVNGDRRADFEIALLGTPKLVAGNLLL